MRNALAILLILLLPLQAQGFTFFDSKPRRLSNEVIFYTGISQLAPGGRDFNLAFQEAALNWQSQTRLTLGVINEYRDPCNNVYVFAVAMTPDICGKDFGGGVAGYARIRWTRDSGIVRGRIQFNDALNWDIYNGPHRNGTVEFTRIARHEIGHILGLSHTVFPGNIMTFGGFKEHLLPDDLCGIAILYEAPEDCTMILEGATRLSGKATTAIFTGGATADRGATYGSSFATTDSINIVSTVVVEDGHIGDQGSLYIVLVLDDGSIYAKDSNGNFAPFAGDSASLPAAESKTLSGANELFIMQDLVAADLGLTSAAFSVYVAYSVTADRDELYYSATPIKVTITE